MPEVTIIAWVNGQAPDLVTLPSGANSTPISNLNSSGSNCSKEVAVWALGKANDLNTQNDRDYANAYLVAHSANTTPPSTIDPSSELKAGNYRLFNDFGNGRSSNPAVGSTPDPCKWLTGTIAGWIGGGQASQYMGQSDLSASGKVYQIAEGRIGLIGQSVSRTVNQGRTVPWIYDVIEFDAAGNYTVSDHATFPTYYIYINGVLHPELTSNQSTVKEFIYGFDASNERNWDPIP